ncbi:hypothetical protein M8494_31825 [Serratia ureilytica]
MGRLTTPLHDLEVPDRRTGAPSLLDWQANVRQSDLQARYRQPSPIRRSSTFLSLLHRLAAPSPHGATQSPNTA